MSFPKAKLHRYYDDISCAPPPGKYDPKFENKVRGTIMDKGQRFSTPKLGHGSSMDSLDSCSSSTRTPILRTPSKAFSRKGPVSTPRLNVKSRIPLPDKLLMPSQLTDSDKLVEQINELTRVHQNQLLEKNEEIANLIEQVNSLNEKMTHLLASRTSVQNLSEYEMEINKLRKELMDLQTSLTVCNQDYTSHVDELKCQISALEENITNHVSINKELEESLIQNNSIFEEMNTKIGKMADEFNLQLTKFVDSMNNVENINKSLMDDYQKTVDLLSKETEENLKSKCTLVELQESIDGCRDDLAKALKRCKMYEVVQTETSKTINVLSKRLMESEIEVDHLNEIQQDLVLKKNILEDQIKTLSEENHMIRESFDKLQGSVRLEMETMKSQLLKKVDSYKQLSSDVFEKQRLCVLEKQNTIDVLLTEIEFYKDKKSEVDHQLAFCQTKMSDYQEEICTLKSSLTEVENDFQEKIGAQRALLSQLSSEYENLKDRTLKEKYQLEKKVVQLNQDKSSLEKVCLKKEKHINDLSTDVDKLNHQISQKDSKIKHLESITTDYDDQIDFYNTAIEEKTKRIETLQKLNAEIKIEKKNIASHLAQKEEECDDINNKFEMESSLLSNLKRDMKEMQDTNQKYMDEIISELVLEKERVSELVNTVENLKALNENMKEENECLQNVMLEYKESFEKSDKERVSHVKFDELEATKKVVQEQLEVIQLFEYERIAQALSLDEFLDQKDELLKTIERQNREIEVFSEAADRDFAARRKLELEIHKLNEEKEQLKDAGKEDSMKVTSLEAQIADLECRNQELIDIIGPFKNQLIQFEQDRNFLLSKTESTEKELRALELEHAKSLGHQNHKQKIKHIVNLNETIANLKKDMEKYRIENNKLRQELRAKKPGGLNADIKKNKENKANTESMSRTTSPAKALKDRNG